MQYEEFLSEFTAPYNHRSDARIEEEFADMCIVFISRQRKKGRRGLAELIRDKLEINKLRDWGIELPNGDRRRVKP